MRTTESSPAEKTSAPIPSWAAMRRMVEVSIGLYCEVLVRIGKGAVVGANVLAQAALGGDIKRGALLLREGKAVHVFDKEMIVARGEMRFRSEHDFN